MSTLQSSGRTKHTTYNRALGCQKIEVFEVLPCGSGFKLFTGAEELSPEVKQALVAGMANMRTAG
jgi:hypothetical protein